MQEQRIFYAAEKAGGRAQSVQHHLSSAEFSIITFKDDISIFYLTESIFFHWDVIRDIGEKGKGYSTRRIRF
jgi:hypothetical protein